ncbi:carboxypeptidase-like regulatory domain-containing protein [Rhodopila sp.]|uniref:carboxypeptidase-like regulatory domain-containing protein n=1 Tax=Rhodopila sp. TaxID=2480087 RepID=UPI003D0C84C9
MTNGNKRWRRVLLSRFFTVPAAMVVAIAGWNIYVGLHAHGLLRGRVVDPAGHPVAGATVILSVHDFVTQVEKARTRTDPAGRFRFDDNTSHLIQLEAKSATASSPRVTIRLWFRGQDRTIAEPLRLASGA